VDREVREYVEYFAKNNRQNFYSCTSTLELGIDIGTVDEVVQIDATHSIASLIQRVGRSGRKEVMQYLFMLQINGAYFNLLLVGYYTKKVILNHLKKAKSPYDILVHQALSTGHSGIKLKDLINQLIKVKQIELSDIEQILNLN
jgi:ATP-dependent Lhr-like helicase